jgi:hypothetical protein
MIAQRDHAQDDARAILSLTKAKIVITETSLRDPARVGVVVDDHRTGHDLGALRDVFGRNESAAFVLELPDREQSGDWRLVAGGGSGERLILHERSHFE